MTTRIRSGQRVLFIGDSITDCGRRGPNAPLGGGYVKLVADMITIREPRKKIDYINKGIGGDVVTGLRNRWQDDVLRHKPHWLSVKIGINDLHRSLRQNPDAVPPELYHEAYDNILSRVKAQLPGCNILLIDPFYISTETSENSFRKSVLDLLPSYLDVVHEMSRKYRTRLVRTHEIFQGLLKTHEPDEFCAEPVHPNMTGHLVIADAVYNALQ